MCSDNCPADSNELQEDGNRNGVGDVCDTQRCSPVCLVDCDDESGGALACTDTGDSSVRCAVDWKPIAGARGCQGTCGIEPMLALSPVLLLSRLCVSSKVWLAFPSRVLAALRTIAETVVARVEGVQCPIPFDTVAYATDFAARIGVAPSRVTVRVVCRAVGASSASADATAHRRELQSDGAELEITVEVSGLSESEAGGVRVTAAMS